MLNPAIETLSTRTARAAVSTTQGGLGCDASGAAEPTEATVRKSPVANAWTGLTHSPIRLGGEAAPRKDHSTWDNRVLRSLLKTRPTLYST